MPTGLSTALPQERCMGSEDDEDQTWSVRRQGAVTYWITSSARCRKDCGTARPSALAVFRLMTSSNFRGLLDGQVTGLRALEDLVHVARSASKQVGNVWSIGHQ